MNLNKVNNLNQSNIKILFCLTFVLLISCSQEMSESDSADIQSNEPLNSEAQYSNSGESSSFHNEELTESEAEASNSEQLVWRGYECTVDCSGHEAGHEWAEENSIDNKDDCQGNSNSFNEGCQEYVEENE